MSNLTNIMIEEMIWEALDKSSGLSAEIAIIRRTFDYAEGMTEIFDTIYQDWKEEIYLKEMNII